MWDREEEDFGGLGAGLSMRSRRSWDYKEGAGKRGSWVRKRGRYSIICQKKSPQPFGSHLAGVPKTPL